MEPILNPRFIDLFAGIGGLRLGFERAGGQCVFSSEWDKHSRETYIANFGEGHAVAGDITQIQAADVPEHDVLLAGFPCQPFSLAGVSKKNSLGRSHGFADKVQGTLFFDVARIIKHHRPAAFLLENVKNLKSHNKKTTFKTMLNVLVEELGYSVQWRIINAKSYVPQSRERIFIVGFRQECGFDFDALDMPDPQHDPHLGDILHPEDGSELPEAPYTFGSKSEVSPRYTLTPNLWAYLQKYALKHRAKGNGFGFGLVGPDDVTRTLSARYYKDGAEILVEQSRSECPRRLTPRECSRLMGFDASGQSDWKIPVSDTQAYRQFGNAVVPPVAESVANLMVSALRSTPVVTSQSNLFASAA